MKKEEFINHFFVTVCEDIIKAFDGGSLMGSTILTLCGFDYLADLNWKILAHASDLNSTKRKNQDKVYKQFVNEWLPKIDKDLVSSCAPYGLYLYAIRCALVHNYGESPNDWKEKWYPRVSHQDEFRNIHLKIQDNNLWVHLPTLIAQYFLVAYEYLNQINWNDQYVIEWSTAFIKIYRTGNVQQNSKPSSLLSALRKEPQSGNATLLNRVVDFVINPKLRDAFINLSESEFPENDASSVIIYENQITATGFGGTD